MPIAKHLIVENGELKVTDNPMPVKSFDAAHYISAQHEYIAGVEEWKQEALVVQNFKEIAMWADRFMPEMLRRLETKTFKDGIYDAPAGLEYEVKEGCNCEIANLPKGADCFGSCSGPTGKVAILSFASPKEEASKEKPDLNERLFEAIQRGLNMAGAMRDNPEEYILGQVLEEIAALQEEIRQLKNKQ